MASCAPRGNLSREHSIGWAGQDSNWTTGGQQPTRNLSPTSEDYSHGTHSSPVVVVISPFRQVSSIDKRCLITACVWCRPRTRFMCVRGFS